MELINVNGLSKYYKFYKNKKYSLSDINIKIYKGEIVCIMGSSGSGKSTLLKILGGIEKPTSGTVSINKLQLNDFKQQDYDRYRQDFVGYVFQEFNLLEGLTLKENIIFPLTMKKYENKEIELMYKNIMKIIDISSFENNYPEQSSGGQQQRAAICRAIIKKPDLILADEPTGNLDNLNAKSILDAFIKINKETETTIIIATHDAVVASHCNRVIFIENGMVYDTLTKDRSTQSFYDKVVVVSSKARGII